MPDQPATPCDPIDHVVRTTWGFDRFRPLQRESIEATLALRDSLTVLPTGGGKSLCYQVPPMVRGGLTLVVSPLIALMRDQVGALTLAGVPAAAIHTHCTAQDRARARELAERGELRLLLVSPERLVMPEFVAWLRSVDVGHIAIDEAHCISQWGHDFRPEYRRLADLRRALPRIAVGAYTATATPRVRDDICRQLGLRDPAVLVGTFDRPNLTYRVVPRVDAASQSAQAIVRNGTGASIVYCMSRRETEELAQALCRLGIDARAYHAGMDARERSAVSDAFADETLDVVVATVAFGMGIDRSDVRCVVHAAMPKSVEHYQQETGRAGRDGEPAECVLLYTSADAQRWRMLIERSAVEALDAASADGEAGLGAVDRARGAQHELLDHMQRFASSARCRHAALSEYFGQPLDAGTCGACDVCLRELRPAPDGQAVAKKIISCVFRCGQCYGSSHVADVLIGRSTASVRHRGHDRLSTFGLLSGLPRERVLSYIGQMIDAGFLVRAAGMYPTLALAACAMDVLKDRAQAQLADPASPRTPARSPAGRSAPATLSPAEHELLAALRSWRRRESDRLGLPAFMVLSDAVLTQLALRRPLDDDALLAIPGIGQRKLESFGPGILRVVAAESDRLGLATGDAATVDVVVRQRAGRGADTVA